jgi:cytochrome c biogenesis protein CcdA
VGGGWVVRANEVGRWLALALLAVCGLTLLLPRLASWLGQPLISAGEWMSNLARGDDKPVSIGSSFLLGIATGLLWTPCAGPILGLLLTSAALYGASVDVIFLLLAYAAGAATSLALAVLIGGWVFAAMRRWLGAGEVIRRTIGAAMLLGVVTILFGWDTGLLARVSLATTGGVEQELIDWFSPSKQAPSAMSTDRRPAEPTSMSRCCLSKEGCRP